MPKTKSNIPKITIKHEWIKKHWVKLLVGTIITVIVLFLIMQIVGFVSRVINCSGPVCQGIGAAVGAAAHFLDDITQGCAKQADCGAVGTNQDSCLKASGCGWGTAASPSPTPGTSSCVNVTGLATGDGGPFKLTCGMFDFALAWLLLPILAALSKTFVSKVVKDAARLSGKSTMDKLREIVKKIGEKIPDVMEQNRDMIDSLTPEGKKIYQKYLTESKSQTEQRQSLYDAAEAIGGAETQTLKSIQADSIAKQQELQDKVTEDLKKSEGDDKAKEAGKDPPKGYEPVGK